MRCGWGHAESKGRDKLIIICGWTRLYRNHWFFGRVVVFFCLRYRTFNDFLCTPCTYFFKPTCSLQKLLCVLLDFIAFIYFYGLRFGSVEVGFILSLRYLWVFLCAFLALPRIWKTKFQKLGVCNENRDNSLLEAGTTMCFCSNLLGHTSIRKHFSSWSWPFRLASHPLLPHNSVHLFTGPSDPHRAFTTIHESLQLISSTVGFRAFCSFLNIWIYTKVKRTVGSASLSVRPLVRFRQPSEQSELKVDGWFAWTERPAVVIISKNIPPLPVIDASIKSYSSSASEFDSYPHLPWDLDRSRDDACWPLLHATIYYYL